MFFALKKGLKKDVLWSNTSQVARIKTPYCEHCLKKNNLAGHHFIGRRTLSTKYYLPNIVVLCPSCHTISSKFSAHLTPKDFKEWFINKFPDRYKLILLREATKMTKWEAEQCYKLEIEPLIKYYNI